MTLPTYTDLTDMVIGHLKTASDHRYWEFCFPTLQDVATHGAAGGYPGFTTYNETTAFYDANVDLIWEALCDDAEATGNTPLQTIASFTVYINDETSFKNALAWYALERAANEVIQSFEEVTKGATMNR